MAARPLGVRIAPIGLAVAAVIAGCATDPDTSSTAEELDRGLTRRERLGRNPDIPANADPAFFDLGLGGPKRALPMGDPGYAGAFKVPTLRNVAIKSAFMHNGVFTSLEDVVAFYATRDTDPGRWYGAGPAFDDLPSVHRGNVNVSEPPYDRRPGEQPRLNESERRDLVRFLRTLTDRQFAAQLPPIVAN